MSSSDPPGTPRTLVSAVIRALSGITPGRNNRDLQADLLAIEASGEDIISRRDTVGSNTSDNPRSRPSEIFHLGGADERPGERPDERPHGRDLTDTQENLETLMRSSFGLAEEVLTTAKVSQHRDGDDSSDSGDGLLPENHPTTFRRQLSDRGGGTSCRGSPSSASLASSFQGRENNLSSFQGRENNPSSFQGRENYLLSSLPAPYCTHPGPNLTFSHFVPDAGQGRHGGSITPGDNEVFQRRGSTAGDVEVSQRQGRASLENVTRRETKRPSERSRDREYQRRFSLGVSRPHVPPPAPLGGHSWPREDPFSPPVRSLVAVEIGSPTTLYGQDNGNNRSDGPTQSGRNTADQPYHIRLICSGESAQHVVWPSMPISDLIRDAGHIFGLDSSGISLVLFSTSPEVLRRESTIFGPPFVAPNSSVMVFSLGPQSFGTAPDYGPRTPQAQAGVVHGGFNYADPPVGPYVNSKLLSTFKLPKFDGVSKNWKTWDRAFQRFLGLHQLDHVLESGFLATVWNVPGAKEANKMVYFLLEDAVAVGSLASKFIRQAVKWNGHEAYIFLHDGYVFSGPQSATILLSQLINLRLKRDENPSLFCMRLVELVEDL
jgi:hypothetical protein